ncbi:MAG: type II toxin-antitoxin system Phd/YefM family antitoxin [Rhodoplanes sp.]
METVAVETDTRLAEFLARAERGEEVVITRAGRPVAKLVLAKGERDIERAREAGKRIRALAKEMNLGPFDWEEWKKYRDEGRR